MFVWSCASIFPVSRWWWPPEAPEALAGRALAIAPLAPDQRVGEVSGAAEARGVSRGMALGEALARCPELVLVAADPLGVAQAWEEVVGALEWIGAAVEPAHAGLAYFEADGLAGLHGGIAGTVAAARRAVRAPVGGRSAHVGPTRFCALAAALAASSRRPVMLEGGSARRQLAGAPLDLLRFRAETEPLLAPARPLRRAHAGRARAAAAGGALRSLREGRRAGAPSGVRRGHAAAPRVVEDRLEELMEVGDVGSGRRSSVSWEFSSTGCSPPPRGAGARCAR